MILRAYSVYDETAENYGVPFFAQSDAVATRSFSRLTLDHHSMVSSNPEDFTLYCIGDFDDDIAKLTAFDNPILIVRATSLQKRVEDQKYSSLICIMGGLSKPPKIFKNSKTFGS